MDTWLENNNEWKQTLKGEISLIKWGLRQKNKDLVARENLFANLQRLERQLFDAKQLAIKHIKGGQK